MSIFSVDSRNLVNLYNIGHRLFELSQRCQNVQVYKIPGKIVLYLDEDIKNLTEEKLNSNKSNIISGFLIVDFTGDVMELHDLCLGGASSLSKSEKLINGALSDIPSNIK